MLQIVKWTVSRKKRRRREWKRESFPSRAHMPSINLKKKYIYIYSIICTSLSKTTTLLWIVTKLLIGLDQSLYKSLQTDKTLLLLISNLSFTPRNYGIVKICLTIEKPITIKENKTS